MIISSKFLQLTPYCLLEYEYNSSVISTKDVTFARIYNAYTGTISYVNHNIKDINIVKEKTNNSFDVTVAQRRDNEWFHFDIDRPLKWYELQNNNIYIEGLWKNYNSEGSIVSDLEIKPEQYILYDTIKLHIVEGYNFDNLAGFIIRVAYTDSNDFSSIYVANYAYVKDYENIEFHKNPFILGDRAYNRYVTFKIPSLKGIIDSNNALKRAIIPNKPPFELKTPNLNNSQINIIFNEVNKISNENGQTLLYTNLPVGSDTNGIVKINIEKEDALKHFNANIQESAVGDYFELYPSHQGQFIEDFLYERTKFGEEYRVVHDIDVYEQIVSYGNYIEKKNQSITFFQTEGFNKPFKFRPIIENPNALTFTIDYTVRLVNIFDPGNPIQTIRKASLTYPDAKKYGKSFSKINIEQGFKPLKIVNKIVKSNNLNNSTDGLLFDINKTNTIKEYVDNFIFIDNYEINSSIENIFINNEEIINSDNPEEIINSKIIFGQNEGNLLLHEFDNFIKFTIYKKENNNLIKYNTTTLNHNYYLIFEDDLGVKLRFKELNINNGYNITKNDGELIFKIDADNIKKIFKNKNNKYYIVASNSVVSDVNEIFQNKYEIVLYSGRFYSYDNKNKLDYSFDIKKDLLLNIKDKIDNSMTELRNIQANITNLINSTKNIQISNVQQDQLNLYLKEFEKIIKDFSSL